MTFNLSKRLKKIVSMCEPVDTIVDVGTDHGKVAITLSNMCISKNVIAIDNKPGPLKFCEENAKEYLESSHSNFTTLLCDGITKLDKKVECGIIIAGIGYDNLIEIISNVSEYNYKYLILSPHTKITELIKYLDKHDIDLIEQENVFEDDKYYYILKAKKRG